MNGAEGQRIDKWLWHARFAPTRSAAQRLAASGHVRLNRDKVRSPSRLVRPGDVLTLALRGGVRVIRVVGMAERRGSFADAQLLYAEQSPKQPGDARAGGAEE